jgi:hypothetical protein
MSIVIIPQPQPFAIPATYGLPGTAGAAGAPGGNVMAIGLAKDAGSMSMSADLVQTTGNEALGKGAAQYIFDAAVDAAWVTAHPKAGFRSSNGRGYRVLSEAPLNVRAFYQATDTDFTAAMQRAVAYSALEAANDIANFSKGGQEIICPPDLYLMSAPIEWWHQLTIRGPGTLSGNGPKFRWTVDCDGFRPQAGNTTGASGTRTASYSAVNSIIRGIGICGPYEDQTDFTGFTESEAHGINTRTGIDVEDCRIDGWAGDGIHALTSVGAGGAEEGNSNNSFLRRNFITNVRNCLFIDGADGNNWTAVQQVCTYARRWTVWDSGFLASNHKGHHSANAGLVPGVPACISSLSGNRYAARVSGTWSNSPSGTTADTADWLYIGAGGPVSWLNIPTWTSGGSFRHGGSYHTDSLNGYGSFDDCYSEGGEAPPQFTAPTLIKGGLWGGARDPVFYNGTLGNRLAGDTYQLLSGGVLGQTRVQKTSGGGDANTALPPLTTHNITALATSIYAQHNLAQGFNSDGTPCYLGALFSYSVGSNPATNDGNVGIATRASGGALTERVIWDTDNGNAWRPWVDATYDLGLSNRQWRDANLSRAVKIAGNQVRRRSGDGMDGSNGNADAVQPTSRQGRSRFRCLRST